MNHAKSNLVPKAIFLKKLFCLPFIAKRCAGDEVVPKAAGKSIDLTKTQKNCHPSYF